jgi:hypothetical protein
VNVLGKRRGSSVAPAIIGRKMATNEAASMWSVYRAGIDGGRK